MAHDFDSVRPIGGLNYEDEVRAIPEGDYLYAENIRNSITAANKGKTLTNVLGNLKIQQYNCPYNGGVFPTGKNRCIGAVEDIVNNGAIYMVWNSEGKHGIYRYYRDKTDPANPYGVVEQVMQYDFGWTKKTRITSMNIAYGDPAASGRGDLLYWCDPIPKKINLTKGNICSKYKTWNVVLPKGFAGASIFFQVIVRAFLTNSPIASINVTVTNGQSISEIMTSIAAQINAGLSTYISAEACDCSITITEKAINGYDVVFSDNSFYVIPDNWYGKTLIDRFWDRCKWQPMQAPQPEYGKDENFGPNYVVGKVFQFRLQYLYDDGEPSALGVWSQIAINNLGCDGTNNPEDNYVDVNFNDPLLLDTETLVLLKKVRVIARELNTGNDRSILELEPCEFLDYDSSTYAHYKFYNNVETLPIDAILAAKLYDDVPLESGAEILSNNRMVELNCLTGYDAPDCVGVTWNVDIADTRSPKLHKILGIVRIFNPFMDNSTDIPDETTEPNILERRSPILYDTAYEVDGVGYPFFGGSFYNSGSVELKNDWAYELKRQIIPEGGFVAYCAGYKYFGISKQIDRNNVSQRSDGSLEASNVTQKDQVKSLLEGFSADPNDGEKDLYSTFEILVPDGEYVIRLASHWCSFDDKLGKGFMYNLNAGTAYQQTSTFVWGVNDYPLGGGYKYDYEIKVTVSGSDVFIGEFIVADLVVPVETALGSLRPSFSGYLFDAEGSTDAVALSKGVTVEKALVRNSIFTMYPPGSYVDYLQKKSDHNGYFYASVYNFSAPLGYPNRFFAYQVGGQIRSGTVQYYENPSGESALMLLYSNQITTSYPTDPIPSHIEIILPTDTPNARALSSTFVSGTVVGATGEPISNTLVLFEHGKYEWTDTNGQYSIIAWGDYFGALSKSRTDYLIFSLNYACQPTYPAGQSVFCFIVPYGSGPSDYNPTNHFNVSDFVINEGNNPNQKAHKRGGKYSYALRYYDFAGRLCSVTKAFDMYLPFVTEDLNTLCLQDGYSNPSQYPAGTFKYGKPSVNWILQPSFNPPIWAAYYQWMRTKNAIYGRYLQWVANSVTYLSAVATDLTPDIETSFANSDAVAIKIQIGNIVDYSSQNPTSQIGYSFESGDRVRLIANRDIDYDSGIQDYEVVSYDLTEQSIIIKNENSSILIESGSLFEVMNAKTIASEQESIYYEVGEVYECTAPNTAGNQHSVTSGTFTNGDTFWRGRLIPVNDDAENFSATYPVVIEDASVSDFYPSQAQDIGRIGIVDPNFKQIRRPMLLKASNQFIPATAVNGLSSFEALNEKELDRANGAIQRAVAINQYIVAISNVRETSNYIQVVTFQQATQGQGVLAIADQFFGTAYPHSKTLGTDLPASVFINDGQIFGFHSKRADAWLYRGDGETTISDKKMKNYFQGLSASGVSDAVAVYDRFHEEYILTVWRIYSQQTTVDIATAISGGYNVTVTIPSGNPQPTIGEDISYKYYQNNRWEIGEGEITSVVIMLDGSYQVTFTTQTSLSIRLGGQISVSYSSPETISWFNGSDAMDKNGWGTFYSFTPEAYCQIGSNILSFKDGEVWIHDKNQVRNNFYGEQHISKVTPVFNDKPEYLKVWNSCILMQYQDNNENNWSAPVIKNNNGQLSRLKEGSWVKKGEHWYAAFKRDLNDLSVNQAIRISQGRALRSTSLTAELENGYTGEVTLYGWLANWTNSERTSK